MDEKFAHGSLDKCNEVRALGRERRRCLPGQAAISSAMSVRC